MSEAAGVETEAAEAPAAPATPLSRAAERLQPLAWIALAFAGCIAPLAYAVNLAFAPFTAVAGLLCLPLIAKARPPSKGLWLLIALLLWALVSYAWSPAAPLPTDFERFKTLQRITGLKLVVELTFYAGFALAMSSVPPRAALQAVRIAATLLTVMAALLVIEGLAGARFYLWIKATLGQPTTPDLAARNVARGCYVLALLLWPLLVVLFDLGRRGWAIGLGVATVLSAVIFRVDAPVAALAAGAIVFAGVRFFGVRALWACAAAVAVYFVLTPVLVSLLASAAALETAGEASWAARLQVWSFVDRLILAEPLRGWGLDASRSWPGLIPLHPHNAALQLWLELGPVGAGLAALFFAWVFSRIGGMARTDRTMAAAAAASTTAYLVIGALSFGVWQEWWLALGAVTAAVCAWAASCRQLPRTVSTGGELVPL